MLFSIFIFKFLYTFYAYSFNTIILIAKICSSLAQVCAFTLATIAINLVKEQNISGCDLKYYIAADRTSLK